MNESCHTYEWVMAHIWMSHVTHSVWHGVVFYIWMSHVTHMTAACHTHEFGLSRSQVLPACVWDSDLVTRMNEPCHAYEWVMAHIWKSHVTHMKESWHAYQWLMSHVTHTKESCHPYERFTSHRWMSHVTHMNGPCHKYITRPRPPRSCLEAGFRPLCPPFVYSVLLFRTKPAFWISTRTAPGPISQVLPGCRVRHPQYSKKLVVRCVISVCLNTRHS